MRITHIEEIDTSDMPTFLQKSVAGNLANITDAMFGGVTMRKPTLADKLDEAIERAAQSKAALEYIAARSLDLRGNIEESIRMQDDVLLNLTGYKRDIAAGVEDEN